MMMTQMTMDCLPCPKGMAGIPLHFAKTLAKSLFFSFEAIAFLA
jgi:hypothetical protein